MFIKCAVVIVLVVLEGRGVKTLINDLCDAHAVEDASCRIENAYCQQAERAQYGLCTCRKGFVAARYERHCIPVLGAVCNTHADCHVKNSACNRGTNRCVCVTQHLVSQDRTECVPPLGRGCADDERCGVRGASCVDGVCQCGKQFVASTSRTQCLPVLGQYCKENLDCAVKHSTCSNGICACPKKDFVEAINNTACLPVVTTILGACEQDTQCTQGTLGRDTACVDQRCVCRYGYTRENITCDPRKELDDWCNHTQQCQMIDHASCVQTKCSCDPYYIPAPGSKAACVKIALLYGSECQHNAQCVHGFGEGGVCVDGACQCKFDYHFIVNHTGRCVPNRMLGETCHHDYQCYLPRDGTQQHVACVDNLCACQQGYAQDLDNTTCSAGVRSRCACTLLPIVMAVMFLWFRGR